MNWAYWIALVEDVLERHGGRLARRHITPRELTFRYFFRHGSSSANGVHIKIILEEMARSFARETEQYRRRKECYDTTIRCDQRFRLDLELDHGVCSGEIAELRGRARSRGIDLKRAYSAAQSMRPDCVPGGDLADNEVAFQSPMLRLQLESGMAELDI